MGADRELNWRAAPSWEDGGEVRVEVCAEVYVHGGQAFSGAGEYVEQTTGGGQARSSSDREGHREITYQNNGPWSSSRNFHRNDRLCQGNGNDWRQRASVASLGLP